MSIQRMIDCILKLKQYHLWLLKNENYPPKCECLYYKPLLRIVKDVLSKGK